MLGKVVCENQRDWDERLPFVLAAYRASQHTSTGFTPNRLFLGREVYMPLDLLMNVEEESEGTRKSDVFVQQMKERADECYEVAREHLRVAAERRKKTYDIRVKTSEYVAGNWVWYWYPRRYQKKSPKWQKSYTGPYLIVRVIEPVNYVLQKSVRSKPFVVHVDKLKRCFGETPVSWLVEPTVVDNEVPSVLPPTIDNGQSETAATTPVLTQVAPARAKTQKRALTPIPEEHVDVFEIDQDTNEYEERVNDRPRRQNRKAPPNLADYVCFSRRV